jgi:hypothetical protein
MQTPSVFAVSSSNLGRPDRPSDIPALPAEETLPARESSLKQTGPPKLVRQNAYILDKDPDVVPITRQEKRSYVRMPKHKGERWVKVDRDFYQGLRLSYMELYDKANKLQKLYLEKITQEAKPKISEATSRLLTEQGATIEVQTSVEVEENKCVKETVGEREDGCPHL